MDTATQTLPVARGPYKLYTEMVPGTGVPVVLMHGFPDNTHLYDRLVPHLAGRRPVVRFDFLGWGRSDKPEGYPYTAANQGGDLAVVADAIQEHLGASQLVLVAHDASGLPAIDWALDHPSRVETLVLLNTYYHPTVGLRRPAQDRGVLHAHHPRRRPGGRPALARTGPAVLHLADRWVHPGPRRPGPARPAAV
jgi:pimeloyl-ACP methyl ester carboxylesterase